MLRSSIISFFTVFCSYLYAEDLKIGTIDTQAVFAAYTKVEANKREYAEQIQSIKKQDRAMLLDIQKISHKIRALEVKKLAGEVEDLQKLNDELDALYDDFNQLDRIRRDDQEVKIFRAKKKREKSSKESLKFILSSIETYANENGYDYIYSRSTNTKKLSDVIYAKESYDLTSQLIDIVNASE